MPNPRESATLGSCGGRAKLPRSCSNSGTHQPRTVVFGRSFQVSARCTCLLSNVFNVVTFQEARAQKQEGIHGLSTKPISWNDPNLAGTRLDLLRIACTVGERLHFFTFPECESHVSTVDASIETLAREDCLENTVGTVVSTRALSCRTNVVETQRHPCVFVLS